VKVNKGYFFGDTYNKTVNFSKAVLWKDRELSVPLDVWERIKRDDIKVLNFKDPKKKELWQFSTHKAELLGVKKRVGQEEQWYFPIVIADISKYETLSL